MKKKGFETNCALVASFLNKKHEENRRVYHPLKGKIYFMYKKHELSCSIPLACCTNK